jgi:hypothetical protein
MRLMAIVVTLAVSTLVHAAPEWMGGSECSKQVRGKSGKEHTIRIGLMMLTENKASCEAVAKAKSANMATGGWNCSAGDVSCSQVTKAEEELGLSQIRQRKPVMNTYLVFTDVDRHLTQVSFWDMPSILGMQLCEAFKADVSKAGVKDATCVAGNQ